MRIGTWNLENLFRPSADSATPSNLGDYEAKLDSLAATIAGLDPDVLAVQEVGSAAALQDLVNRLDGAWTSELADPDGRGIRVGFISKLAMTDVAQISAFPSDVNPIQISDNGDTMDAMGRPALRVRVDASGATVDLISTHLKSKLLSYPGSRFSPKDEGERARYAVYALNRRAVEAATVRVAANDILDGKGTDRRLVVAGDLNDGPDAATTQILLGPGGSEFGTGGYGRPDKGDGARLWNLAPLIPDDQRFSRVYRGRAELIDHILVSHALTEAITSVTTGDSATPSITDNPTARRDAPGSDHRPVLAVLELG
jgi:predicted extracellular nuclease